MDSAKGTPGDPRRPQETPGDPRGNPGEPQGNIREPQENTRGTPGDWQRSQPPGYGEKIEKSIKNRAKINQKSQTLKNLDRTIKHLQKMLKN